MTNEATRLMRKLEDIENKRKRLRKKLAAALADEDEEVEDKDKHDDDYEDDEDYSATKKRKGFGKLNRDSDDEDDEDDSPYNGKPHPPEKSDPTQRYVVTKEILIRKREAEENGYNGKKPFGFMRGMLGLVAGHTNAVGCTSVRVLAKMHRTYCERESNNPEYAKFYGKYSGGFKELIRAATSSSNGSPAVLREATREEADRLQTKAMKRRR